MRAVPVDRALLRRVAAETRGSRGRIALIGLVSALGTPLALLNPIALKIAVDSVLGDADVPGFVAAVLPTSVESSPTRLLAFAAVLQVVVITGLQAQGMGLFVLQTHTEERMTLRLRAQLMNHAQKLSFSFHDDRGTADSIYRIQYDAPALGRIAVYSVIPLVTAGITLVAMATVIVRIDLQLALVAVTVVPLLYVLGRWYRIRMRPEYANLKSLESSTLGAVQEVLGAIRVVKAFGREDFEEARFVGRASDSARAKVRVSAAEALLSTTVSLATAAGTGAVLFMGVQGIRAGRVSLGELLVVISYLGQLYGPVQTISKQAASLQGHLASVERVFSLLDEQPDVCDQPGAIGIDRAEGELRLWHVSARYGQDPPVLRDVNISIPAGARVGIRGRTGAGKTTLVSVLNRFIDPLSGKVLLDGIDVQNYALADLRRQFAVMLQDPLLFSTTIRENIAYARPDATWEEIEVASRAAGAHDFVTGLPSGYDTIVGERGLRLSGGERQRVSLARAFLRDAPVLILDEPTSSVDIHTERSIMESMESLMAGRTTVMIAHRLSTLDGCDFVIDLEDGRVVGHRASSRPFDVRTDWSHRSPRARARTLTIRSRAHRETDRATDA